MNGADWFDFGMGELPRKVARLALVLLVVFSGGRFVTWYAQEKTTSLQEVAQDYLDGVVAKLSTPTVLQHAAAVPQ